jgi:hypothetical protein
MQDARRFSKLGDFLNPLIGGGYRVGGRDGMSLATYAFIDQHGQCADTLRSTLTKDHYAE